MSGKAVERAFVVCLQETWLEPFLKNDKRVYDGIQHDNSVGRGKGISTLYKSPFSFMLDVKRSQYQLTKLSSFDMDIINVYRSNCADTNMFIADIQKIITDKKTVIIGDFNLCYLTETNHPLFKFLNRYGFHQLVKSLTHMKGRTIDLVFINAETGDENFRVSQQSPFFTDHDLIEITSGSIHN